MLLFELHDSQLLIIQLTLIRLNCKHQRIPCQPRRHVRLGHTFLRLSLGQRLHVG